jgi:hypothetical protein
MPIRGEGKGREEGKRREGEERGRREEEGHGRRFNAFSQASQVHSRENSRDTTEPEQLPLQAGDNVG